MQQPFKKGDKVRCIEPNYYVNKGEIYTIERVYTALNDEEYVNLVEFSYTSFFPYRFELVEEKQQQTEKEMKTPYQEAQEAWIKMVDLKEGDTVRVLTTAKNLKYGWCNDWVPGMDLAVGEEYMVARILDNMGIRLSDKCSYPFFVLEKVAKALPQPIKISDSYKAEFQKDGGIKVGCQNISFDLLKEIYETAAKIKNNK